MDLVKCTGQMAAIIKDNGWVVFKTDKAKHIYRMKDTERVYLRIIS